MVLASAKVMLWRRRAKCRREGSAEYKPPCVDHTESPATPRETATSAATAEALHATTHLIIIIKGIMTIMIIIEIHSKV